MGNHKNEDSPNKHTREKKLFLRGSFTFSIAKTENFRPPLLENKIQDYFR